MYAKLEPPSTGASGERARSSQSEAPHVQMDVDQPVQQRRAAGDVFGAPAVVTRVMAYCATLEDVSRLSRTCRGAARAPWPPVAPWIRAASAIGEPRRRRRRRRDGPAFGRRVAHALVVRIALPEAVRATIVRAVDTHAGVMKRVVEEASARAAGVVAVKLAPATCRARRTAAICVRAMAHAALAGVLVADGPMIAREAAASALTSLLRRVRSGPERAPRDAVLADLRERGFDADLARLANGGDIRAAAVVRSAARFLSRALVSRARRDAV